MARSETQLANIEFHRTLIREYDHQPFFRPENRARVRALLTSFAEETSGGSLLDLGCGTGFIFDLGHDLFGQLHGVDITAEMLERVEPRSNLSLCASEAESLPFRNGSFDVATLHGVLHHLDNPALVFGEVRRVLRSGGVFYIDESPSSLYIEAMRGLDGRTTGSDWLGGEVQRTIEDARNFERRHAVSADVTRKAMVQNYQRKQLNEDYLRGALRGAGFQHVDFRYRRFVGEDFCRNQEEGTARSVEAYLQAILPLSRHLFKYFVIVAR